MSRNKLAQPVVYNIFDQDPTLPRMIGLSIERSDDKEDTSGGTLSIGEYDPRFADAAASATKIPVAHAESARWTIAMDGLSLNGQSYNLSSRVQDAAPNTSIALIDSGTSLAYIPAPVVDFIYGNIDGAVHLLQDGQNSWVVPCTEPANLTFSFGYVPFPVQVSKLHTDVVCDVAGICSPSTLWS